MDAKVYLHPYYLKISFQHKPSKLYFTIPFTKDFACRRSLQKQTKNIVPKTMTLSVYIPTHARRNSNLGAHLRTACAHSCTRFTTGPEILASTRGAHGCESKGVIIERVVDDKHIEKCNDSVWIGVLGGVVGRGRVDIEVVNRVEDGEAKLGDRGLVEGLGLGFAVGNGFHLQ